jgi:hypothetical protein
MKYNITILFVAIVLMGSATFSNCNAQNPPAPIPNPDATLLKQVGQSGAFYFKKSDVIKGNAFFYALGTVEDVYKENDTITLTFSFQVAGNVMKTPENFSVSITSKSKDAKYGSTPKFQIFSDGKLTVDVETSLMRPRRQGALYGTEDFTTNTIELKSLKKLVKGKRIVVRFGQTEMTLSTKQQKTIEDFYNLANN